MTHLSNFLSPTHSIPTHTHTVTAKATTVTATVYVAVLSIVLTTALKNKMKLNENKCTRKIRFITSHHKHHLLVIWDFWSGEHEIKSLIRDKHNCCYC